MDPAEGEENEVDSGEGDEFDPGPVEGSSSWRRR